MFNIFNSPLTNWDEAWYAAITRNMIMGKSWLFPYWNGQFYFDKPPLYFWLSAIFVKLFGTSEFSYRAVSIIAGLLAVWLVYLLAKLLFNRRVGILAAAIFLSLGQVFERFTHGDLDALVVCLTLSTLYFYYLPHKKSWIFSGISLGLSVLTKGWLLGFFPVLIIILDNFLRQKQFPKTALILVTGLFAAGWWYAAGAIYLGKSFIDWYLNSPVAANHWSTANLSPYYLYHLFLDLGWYLALLSVLFISRSKLTRVLLSWVTVSTLYILAISGLTNQFHWYLLPAYTLVAIILAIFAEKLLKNSLFWLFLLIPLFLLQIILQTSFYDQHLRTDNSAQFAQLGLEIKDKQLSGQVYLDSLDFPTFMFYSDLPQALVVSDHPLPNEWWMLTTTQLQATLTDNQSINLVTQRPDFWRANFTSVSPLTLGWFLCYN